ncbi:MAG: hypothetical protein EP326_01500 [Deltaproteobacteria bacterium]|nr:MAG: hypothetical protein EP326_01500 [Deltaproteobacteria bacterium]
MKSLILTFLFSISLHAELLPSGTIAAFDLAACPTGWTLHSTAYQRTLVGSGSGENDQLANPLTTRTFGDMGGFEATMGVEAKTAAAGTNTPGTANYPAATSGIYFAYGPKTNNTDDTTLAGVKADSNMPPYYVILYCRKD